MPCCIRMEIEILPLEESLRIAVNLLDEGIECPVEGIPDPDQAERGREDRYLAGVKSYTKIEPERV